MANPVVGIIMGSRSDWGVMENAAQTLDELGVAYEAKVVSAHRTPDRLYEYAKSARDRGLKAIIAGAGGAAHLPGMAAAMTPPCTKPCCCNTRSLASICMRVWPGVISTISTPNVVIAVCVLKFALMRSANPCLSGPALAEWVLACRPVLLHVRLAACASGCMCVWPSLRCRLTRLQPAVKGQSNCQRGLTCAG